MTRGPAKPISAFGSAMFRSPSIAKLAVTPPVVGSVSTEMYGSRARSSRASAPQIFAICISDSAPSIIRAPPEQQTITTGARIVDRALDAARDLLADDHAHAAADEPVLHRGDDGRDAVDRAGRDDDRIFQPGGSMPAFSRALYGFVSVNASGSVETRPGSYSVHSSSNSMRSRSVGVDAEVVRAFRTDVQVGGEILVVDDLRAAGTLDPESFGHPAGLGRLSARSACGSS